MVCYCPERKILYIHIPKTGGLTIETILVELYGFKKFTYKSNSEYEFLASPRGKLGIFRYILKYSNEAMMYDLNSYYKFSFVRNPYTRGISAVRFLYCASTRQNIPFASTINEFIDMTRTNNYFYTHFNTTQYRHLLDLNSELDFDFIGRFENFNNDLKTVLYDELGLAEIPFSHIHINKSDKTIIQFDEGEIKQIVNEVNFEDFDRFGYERELN
jgi:hypothetical protein